MSDATRSRPALVAGAVLVVAVVTGVLVFGVNRPPALDTLADQPDPPPPGRLAWLASSGGEQCVVVADRDGTSLEEVSCQRGGGELLGWDDAGIVLRRWDGGDRAEVVDPGTGERSTYPTGTDGARPPGHGRAVRTVHRDGRLTVVASEDDDTVWVTDAPDVYDVTDGVRSPDGEWFVLVDTAERLLLVPADGSAPPRVWSDRVPRWQRPVWEGTPVG